jgi:pyridoxamine 5'-phosphate oxidase
MLKSPLLHRRNSVADGLKADAPQAASLCETPAGGKRLGMADDPHKLFEEWFAEARLSEPNDPNAVALATGTPDGRPSLRMVLLKGHDQRGFVFYTNLDSRKGGELGANPHAALLFHWKSLRRQVRIEGAVEPVSQAEADAYFATRSRDSQLGAWASDQSRPLAERALFESRFEEVRVRFEGGDVPRPPRWSGFRVLPRQIEFWNDRAHRLHERRLFVRMDDGWSEGLLYP